LDQKSHNRLGFCLPHYLDTLGLEQNKISGSIPTQFGRLESLVFLALDENELTGIIVDTLGGLDSLQSLQIPSNTIVGEVPVSICDLKDGSLESIVVDCIIGCSCCTDECQGKTSQPPMPSPSLPPSFQPSSAPVTLIPTQSPSPQPTASSMLKPSSTPTSVPTSSPSSSPTQCVAELAVVDEAGCISEGDTIHLSLKNCNTENDDWIGIYGWDTNPENLGNGYLWSWACGSQDCRTEATDGDICFGQNHVDEIIQSEWRATHKILHEYCHRTIETADNGATRQTPNRNRSLVQI
jgi:hypothetical protein